MDISGSLNKAHVEFVGARLALIHIPPELAGFFLQSILQLLIPDDHIVVHAASRESSPSLTEGNPELVKHAFLNLSITPNDCSIACSRAYADRIFVPAQQRLPESLRRQVAITEDDFIVMRVHGDGMGADQRVLELTAPLAMAGISIFFVTTYFSDYILVPTRAKKVVISALEARGFIVDQLDHPDSTTNTYSHRRRSSGGAIEAASLDGTSPFIQSLPSFTNLDDLQKRTFALLKQYNIVPTIDHSLHLVQCAARNPHGSGTSIALKGRLQLALIKILIAGPRFLSLTMTATESPSILLEKSLLPYFAISQSPSISAASSESLLLGSNSDTLYPIMLDLRHIPLESTGIVCGVAGRLAGGTRHNSSEAVEMSYLSTARAGYVIVTEQDAEHAVEMLREKA